ncbi:MAG: DedA family protein [Gammaproteobacteria bacterium]|nr:DedA family protein [Gammaproteobacteria bacterium]MDH5652865.1 DedA family protein [Gammaproteobacteria bacterium]
MRLFGKLYERVMIWSQHPHAPRYLAGLSFAESSFFPIPPDVMLAPMSLARPDKAWRFAGLTTLSSLVGGIAGYLIGMFAFELIEPLLHSAGYWDKYLLARQWFEQWGLLVIFIAGFSPIPYKIFTITAGVVGMSFLPFVIASLVGRGARFFLVAGLMVWGGERMEKTLREYIDMVGWVVILASVAGYFLLK